MAEIRKKRDEIIFASDPNLNNEHIFFTKWLRKSNNPKHYVEETISKSICTRCDIHRAAPSTETRSSFVRASTPRCRTNDHTNYQTSCSNARLQHRSRSSTQKRTITDIRRRCVSSHGTSSTLFESSNQHTTLRQKTSTVPSHLTTMVKANKVKSKIPIRISTTTAASSILTSSSNYSSILTLKNQQQTSNNKMKMSASIKNTDTLLTEQLSLAHYNNQQISILDESETLANDENSLLAKSRGENFYKLISDHYGVNVEKILRYHDIDALDVLSKTNESDLFEMFEKPNNRSSTSSEIIELKKNVCSIINGRITVKIGIKNKLALLLQIACEMINEYERLKSLSITTISSKNIDEEDQSCFKHYQEMIKQAITETLVKENHFIHGIKQINISGKDFKTTFTTIQYNNKILCSVQCLCGHRIQIRIHEKDFQISNFLEHIRMEIKEPTVSANDSDTEHDQTASIDEASIGDKLEEISLNVCYDHPILSTKCSKQMEQDQFTQSLIDSTCTLSDKVAQESFQRSINSQDNTLNDGILSSVDSLDNEKPITSNQHERNVYFDNEDNE